MENQPTTIDLKIHIILVWIMALAGLILPFIIFFGPFEKWNNHLGLFGACLSIQIFILIIFLSDAIQSKIKNKPFWVLSILIMPPIAQIVYLIRKTKILYSDNETNV